MNSSNKANNKNRMAIFALTLLGLAHISHACTSISTHGKYHNTIADGDASANANV